ncbi:SIMPL domain-containing protein [Serinicoccus kebangsaanensis]|uniref:SIMPL domain-containing protein n=1 Tax=Serinicoccus kebangsaanensis TaxID=2602069 RepID=UPI00124EAE40|nr:SIMPL domain-containing protein [Serinicoccus kebangsaanensis]
MDLPTASDGPDQRDPATDRIVVTGTGRAGATPDSVVLDLYLEGHGSTVAQALQALTAASQACTDALPDHRVRTHGLTLHPRHDHHGAPRGHTAAQSLRVVAPDPGRAGELVAVLAEAVGDALTVQSLRPEVSDVTALEVRAREAALLDARRRAEEYAALVDRAVGRAVTIEELPEHAGPVPGDAAAMSMEATGPPVDAADHEVRVLVRVVWALTG